MSKQTQNLSYPEQFLVRRGSLESWGKYIEDYKQKHKVDEYIVPAGQLIAVKETKEDKNYRLKLGNGVDDFYTLSYLDTDLEEKLNQEIQDRITSDEELLANDLVILNEAKQYADDLISGALKRVIVDELPTEDIDLNTIYMVLRPESEPNNIYDEYMYIDDDWEKLGSTEINLDDYYTKDEVDNKIIDETNKVYQAVYVNGRISKSKSDYPGIKVKDLIIDVKERSSSDESHVNKLYYVEEGSPNSQITLHSLGDVDYIEGEPPTYAPWSEEILHPYRVGGTYLSSNGNIYYCLSKGGTSSGAIYTWKTYTFNVNVSGHLTKDGDTLGTTSSRTYFGNSLPSTNENIQDAQIYDFYILSDNGLNFTDSRLNILTDIDTQGNLTWKALSDTVVGESQTPTTDASTFISTYNLISLRKGMFYLGGDFEHPRVHILVSINYRSGTLQWLELTNTYTKSEIDNLLNSKQDTITVSGHITKSGSNIENTATKIYPAVLNNDGTINTAKSNYPDIVVGDFICDGTMGIDDGTLWRVAYITPNNAVTLTLVGKNIEIINDEPVTTSSNYKYYRVGAIVLSKNGYMYECTNVTSSSGTYTYTWQRYGIDLSNYYTKTESDTKFQEKLTVGNGIDITNNEISAKVDGYNLYFANNKIAINTTVLGSSYALRQELANGDSTTFALASKSNLADYQPKLTAGTNITIDNNNVISASGGGLSYTFTNGLTESSGTVGIDLASGSKLLIDTNHKLDVDLSSKQDTIDNTHKLSADLVDDTNSTNKFVTANEKQGWNNKADTTDIPTNVSELNNDSGYQTSSDVALAIIDKEDKTTISTDTTSTTVSLTLVNNTEYRYTQDLTSLTLTMPNGDFIASVVFASGSTPTSMTYDSSIKWSGNDVSSNAFVPQANMEYEIVFWYNGLSVNAVVRGVA